MALRQIQLESSAQARLAFDKVSIRIDKDGEDKDHPYIPDTTSVVLNNPLVHRVALCRLMATQSYPEQSLETDARGNEEGSRTFVNVNNNNNDIPIPDRSACVIKQYEDDGVYQEVELPEWKKKLSPAELKKVEKQENAERKRKFKEEQKIIKQIQKREEAEKKQRLKEAAERTKIKKDMKKKEEKAEREAKKKEEKEQREAKKKEENKERDTRKKDLWDEALKVRDVQTDKKRQEAAQKEFVVTKHSLKSAAMQDKALATQARHLKQLLYQERFGSTARDHAEKDLVKNQKQREKLQKDFLIQYEKLQTLRENDTVPFDVTVEDEAELDDMASRIGSEKKKLVIENLKKDTEKVKKRLGKFQPIDDDTPLTELPLTEEQKERQREIMQISVKKWTDKIFDGKQEEEELKQAKMALASKLHITLKAISEKSIVEESNSEEDMDQARSKTSILTIGESTKFQALWHEKEREVEVDLRRRMKEGEFTEMAIREKSKIACREGRQSLKEKLAIAQIQPKVKEHRWYYIEREPAIYHKCFPDDFVQLYAHAQLLKAYNDQMIIVEQFINKALVDDWLNSHPETSLEAIHSRDRHPSSQNIHVSSSFGSRGGRPSWLNDLADPSESEEYEISSIIFNSMSEDLQEFVRSEGVHRDKFLDPAIPNSPFAPNKYLSDSTSGDANSSSLDSLSPTKDSSSPMDPKERLRQAWKKKLEKKKAKKNNAQKDEEEKEKKKEEEEDEFKARESRPGVIFVKPAPEAYGYQDTIDLTAEPVRSLPNETPKHTSSSSRHGVAVVKSAPEGLAPVDVVDLTTESFSSVANKRYLISDSDSMAGIPADLEPVVTRVVISSDSDDPKELEKEERNLPASVIMVKPAPVTYGIPEPTISGAMKKKKSINESLRDSTFKSLYEAALCGEFTPDPSKTSSDKSTEGQKEPVDLTAKNAPVDKTAVKEPVNKTAVAVPVDLAVKKAPVDKTAAKEPVDSIVKKAPVDKTAAAAPVDLRAAPVDLAVKKVPVDKTAAAAPVALTVKKAPVDKNAGKEPVDSTAAAAPVDLAVKKVPVDKTAAAAPVDLTVKKAPVDKIEPAAVANLVVKKAPIDKIAAKEPVDLAVKKAPVDKTAAKEPVDLAVQKAPIDKTAAKEPVDLAVKKVPVDKTAAKEPVDLTVKKAPVDKTAAKEPVDLAVKKAPVDKTAAKEPVDLAVKKAPVDKTAVKDPVDLAVKKAPVDKTAAAAPVDLTVKKVSVDKTAVKEPVDLAVKKAPVDKTAAAAPVDLTVKKAPVDKTAAKEPVDLTVKKAPVDKTTAKEPVDKTGAKEPVDLTVKNAPVDNTTAKEPVDKTAAKEPVDLAVKKAPVDETAAKEPVDLAVKKAPVDETAAAAPVDLTVKKAPVDKTAAKEPVDKTVRNEPVDLTVDRTATADIKTKPKKTNLENPKPTENPKITISEASGQQHTLIGSINGLVGTLKKLKPKWKKTKKGDKMNDKTMEKDPRNKQVDKGKTEDDKRMSTEDNIEPPITEFSKLCDEPNSPDPENTTKEGEAQALRKKNVTMTYILTSDSDDSEDDDVRSREMKANTEVEKSNAVAKPKKINQEKSKEHSKTSVSSVTEKKDRRAKKKNTKKKSPDVLRVPSKEVLPLSGGSESDSCVTNVTKKRQVRVVKQKKDVAKKKSDHLDVPSKGGKALSDGSESDTSVTNVKQKRQDRVVKQKKDVAKKKSDHLDVPSKGGKVLSDGGESDSSITNVKQKRKDRVVKQKKDVAKKRSDHLDVPSKGGKALSDGSESDTSVTNVKQKRQDRVVKQKKDVAKKKSDHLDVPSKGGKALSDGSESDSSVTNVKQKRQDRVVKQKKDVSKKKSDHLDVPSKGGKALSDGGESDSSITNVKQKKQDRVAKQKKDVAKKKSDHLDVPSKGGKALSDGSESDSSVTNVKQKRQDRVVKQKKDVAKKKSDHLDVPSKGGKALSDGGESDSSITNVKQKRQDRVVKQRKDVAKKKSDHLDVPSKGGKALSDGSESDSSITNVKQKRQDRVVKQKKDVAKKKSDHLDVPSKGGKALSDGGESDSSITNVKQKRQDRVVKQKKDVAKKKSDHLDVPSKGGKALSDGGESAEKKSDQLEVPSKGGQALSDGSESDSCVLDMTKKTLDRVAKQKKDEKYHHHKEEEKSRKKNKITAPKAMIAYPEESGKEQHVRRRSQEKKETTEESSKAKATAKQTKQKGSANSDNIFTVILSDDSDDETMDVRIDDVARGKALPAEKEVFQLTSCDSNDSGIKCVKIAYYKEKTNSKKETGPKAVPTKVPDKCKSQQKPTKPVSEAREQNGKAREKKNIPQIVINGETSEQFCSVCDSDDDTIHEKTMHFTGEVNPRTPNPPLPSNTIHEKTMHFTGEAKSRTPNPPLPSNTIHEKTMHFTEEANSWTPNPPIPSDYIDEDMPNTLPCPKERVMKDHDDHDQILPKRNIPKTVDRCENKSRLNRKNAVKFKDNKRIPTTVIENVDDRPSVILVEDSNDGQLRRQNAVKYREKSKMDATGSVSADAIPRSRVPRTEERKSRKLGRQNAVKYRDKEGSKPTSDKEEIKDDGNYSKEPYHKKQNSDAKSSGGQNQKEKVTTDHLGNNANQKEKSATKIVNDKTKETKELVLPKDGANKSKLHRGKAVKKKKKTSRRYDAGKKRMQKTDTQQPRIQANRVLAKQTGTNKRRHVGTTKAPQKLSLFQRFKRLFTRKNKRHQRIQEKYKKPESETESESESDSDSDTSTYTDRSSVHEEEETELPEETANTNYDEKFEILSLRQKVAELSARNARLCRFNAAIAAENTSFVEDITLLSMDVSKLKTQMHQILYSNRQPMMNRGNMVVPYGVPDQPGALVQDAGGLPISETIQSLIYQLSVMQNQINGHCREMNSQTNKIHNFTDQHIWDRGRRKIQPMFDQNTQTEPSRESDQDASGEKVKQIPVGNIIKTTAKIGTRVKFTSVDAETYTGETSQQVKVKEVQPGKSQKKKAETVKKPKKKDAQGKGARNQISTIVKRMKSTTIGWFPAGRVKPLKKKSDCQGAAAAPTRISTAELMIASHHYLGKDTDELSFIKGSLIEVINKESDDWWLGAFYSDQGKIPSEYTAPSSSESESETDSL